MSNARNLANLLGSNTKVKDVDVDGTELILDADADTSITADTDDQIDIRVGGSDQIKIATGEVALNDASADIDFRVESDNKTHALFVEGSTGHVGIGTSTLNVSGNDTNFTSLSIIETVGNRSGILEIGDNQNQDTGGIGSINFVGHYQDANHKIMSQIKSASDGGTSGQRGGNIKIFTKENGSTTLTERVRVHSGGVVSFNNGIELGSGVDATAANTLDDYEEGNWTPTLTSTSGVTKTAASANLGRYTKIGNIVNATGTVAWDGTETLSGLVAVGGLPFTSVNTNGYRSSAAMGAAHQVNQPSSYQNGLGMSMDQNTTLIWVVARSTSSFTHYPVIGNTGAIYGINITYRTA